jgi:hypothetical protein
MSQPTTFSASSTPVGPGLGRPGTKTGAEVRNVPSFRALLEGQKAYFATEGGGR